MNLKKQIVTFTLLIIGSLLITKYIQSPLPIFYGGVGTAIIIDIARDLME